jgi:hypothetical protein
MVDHAKSLVVRYEGAPAGDEEKIDFRGKRGYQASYRQGRNA